MTTPEQPDRTDLRLTDRGRMAVSLFVCLVLLGALVLIDRAAGHKGHTTRPTPSPVSPSVTPSGSPGRASSVTPSPESSASPSADPSGQAEGDASSIPGMVHTGLTGTGTWTTSTLSIAPAKTEPRVRKLVVKAEGGTGIDADEAARQVMRILNDPRGWLGYQGQSFQLVPDAKQADFTVYLASPGRVQKMCPLDVQMTWSCSAGRNVLLNTDRWLHMVPAYTDLTAYREYMVNHEVGHYLGFGHRPCPGAGKPAPVMLQQSKTLQGCVANSWPTTAEKG